MYIKQSSQEYFFNSTGTPRLSRRGCELYPAQSAGQSESERKSARPVKELVSICRLHFIFIIIFMLSFLTTFAFGKPGMRTYTKEDVERKSEMEHEKSVQEENEIQKTEFPAMYSEEENYTEKDNEQGLNEGQPYKVEHYIVKKPRDENGRGNIKVNIAKSNIEALKINLRKMQGQKELDPDCIPVSENDIADAKRRILDKLGIDVSAAQ